MFLNEGQQKSLLEQMDVSENSGTPKSSILIGFSIINHPFWDTPIFGNIQISHDHGDATSTAFWKKQSRKFQRGQWNPHPSLRRMQQSVPAKKPANLDADLVSQLASNSTNEY